MDSCDRYQALEYCASKMQMSVKERKFLADVLKGANSYLEIGSGFSTIWSSQFVPKIVSVEARKKWYWNIKNLMQKLEINNVEYHLLEPESCAYYEDGIEKWVKRDSPEGSDYGKTEEFTGQLKGVDELLNSHSFDVVLVDGQVRKQTIELLIAHKFKGRVLLHDVTPERDYMNREIWALDEVKIVNQAESLAELKLVFDKSGVEKRRSTGIKSQQLNKIIGFCISNKDCEYDFKFAEFFPWLNSQKITICGNTVWLWGHGEFSQFIKKHTDRIQIIAGYTEGELEFLSGDRPDNRAVFINFYGGRVEFENDHIGSFRVFYGKNGQDWCVSSTEDLVLQTIGRQMPDKVNLVQYLLVGHLTGEQTIYPHIFSMLANSRLTVKGGRFETSRLEPLEFMSVSNPLETLFEITQSTIKKYTDCYDKMFLPLSGGYDSRLLAAYMSRPQRIIARSYDYAYPIENGYEVGRAREIATAAGINNWRPCDIGTDFYADYAKSWFSVFGTSHHHHGMYVMRFFDKCFGSNGAVLPTASGYIGDVFAGNQLGCFVNAKDSEQATKFYVAQHINAEGFKPEELNQLLNFNVAECLPVIYERWHKQWDETEGQEWQKFILNFVRHRGRTHISYLCMIADLYGAAITPYTDKNYIRTLLSLGFENMLGRKLQEQMMQRYLPQFRLDNRKMPQYKHCINFLCMRNRKFENIFPITVDRQIQRHPYLNYDYLEQMVQNFARASESKEIIYGHQDILCLFRLNTLRPLFFAQQSVQEQTENFEICSEIGKV
jgi:hypothetical protein